MPRRRPIDVGALAALLAPGHAVASHAELRAIGLGPSTITYRIRPGGPWQRALPGVVIGHRGTPTAYERRLAALRYAGAGAALTGLDALRELGVTLPARLDEARVHVLVPHGVHRTSSGYAVLTRTRRTGTLVVRRSLPCATVARAVVDACRRLEELDAVRGVVSGAVQQRRCTVADIAAEVRRAPRQRTALLRVALGEVAAGVRSTAEAQLKTAFARYGVPAPRWNAEVRTTDGALLAVADALWDDAALAVELDSMAWHLSPAAYRRTQARQRRLAAAGITVVPIAPADVLTDPQRVCEEVLAALRARRRAGDESRP